jgi:hypothetical protein
VADQKAFELLATFGARAPYRILADGGIVLNLELEESALDNVTALYIAAKGKNLRVLIEVIEPARYAVPKEQTKWIKEEETI